jgi:hypothetical protein
MPFLHRLRQHDARLLFASLLLLAFAFRALIPVGYMPDMNALQKGVFTLTICTSQGAQNIIADEDGQPVQKHQAKQDGTCLYGWAPKLLLQAPLLALSVSYLLFVETVQREANLNVVQEFFSALQARAPPKA